MTAKAEEHKSGIKTSAQTEFYGIEVIKQKSLQTVLIRSQWNQVIHSVGHKGGSLV